MHRFKSRVALPAAFCCAITAGGAGNAQQSDDKAMPLGDGRAGSMPLRGHVYSCMTRFLGGGAEHDGEWLGADSWDATRKIHVQGDVSWPNARFSVQTLNGVRKITGNGLPTGHTTGIFPIHPSDPAYRIDRNPNRIEARQVALNLPMLPEIAADAGCLPMGMVGITSGGVAIFNALDAAGRDAVAHEVQDHCNGHPQMSGQYHYHGISPCHAAENENNALIGYALDGFGIYSSRDESGKELSNADLDECHGRISRISWDGQRREMYHYVLTKEYPYTIGCFRGRLVSGSGEATNGEQPATGGPGFVPVGAASRLPPQEALDSCGVLSLGERCEFVSPRGDHVSGICRSPSGLKACVPDRMPAIR
ncbi:YHYH protein [Candidatus Methylospira mobilis]|nr:YHYH protein [Candidatus Methylospira mobilis]WNV03355.1 YHYH protein [Candidatus Methylospira mobilis]